MNITIICEVLGEANNGTSIAAYNLIEAMKKRGHNVKVVCPDKDKANLEGYYILPKKTFTPLINWILKKNEVSLAGADLKLINEACKDADVVHILVPLFISRKVSKYIKNKLHKPITAGFHAQAENLTSHLRLMNFEFANRITYKWYNKNVFCRADGIHYPTSFIRNYFENVIDKKTPAYVISNGVNPAIHKMTVIKPKEYKNKFCILFIGRLSKEKSHEVLLKANIQISC